MANEELETKAGQLTTQKSQVEGKNREIELAKQELEEKAEQLTLTSKYKSEFLANMSHELRTPLNSLLILAEMLSDNSEGNLTDKQREFAQTIHASGSDLLSLINDILDMAKIESGTMAIDVGDVPFARPPGLRRADVPPGGGDEGHRPRGRAGRGPAGGLSTDAKRLQQVLRNLLSNAFKFTEKGEVEPAGRAGDGGLELATTRCSTAAGRVAGLLGDRHGDRHPAGQAQGHLRAVPAGRHGDEPEIRRDGPGPVDQPGDRPAARRRDPGAEQARARGAPSPCTCRWTTCPPRPRPPAGDRRPSREPGAAPAEPDRSVRGEASPGPAEHGRRRRPTTATRSSPATGSS